MVIRIPVLVYEEMVIELEKNFVMIATLKIQMDALQIV